MHESLTPRSVAEEIIESLKQLTNPEGVVTTQRYFKRPVSTYGIKAATIRRITQDWQRRLKPAWDLNPAVELCNLLIQEEELESKLVRILILSGFTRLFEPNLLSILKKWVEHHADNWAVVDTLASSVLSPLIDKYPGIIPEITPWTDSPVLWVRRAAIVTFVPHARKGKYLDSAYAISESLFNDTEDLIHKAVGWLLREAGKTDAPRLEEFLLTHGPKIPRTTVRYAIERFPEPQRKRLLHKTRKQTRNKK